MANNSLVFSNNVSTTLASPITSATQTTITLTSAANLPTIPSGDQFFLTLNDAATQSVFEILGVTAISGSTLTVTRGQDGTTATTWLAGDYAVGSCPRAALANFAQKTETPNFTYGLTTTSLTVSGNTTSGGISSSGQITAEQFISSGPVVGTLISGTSIESNGSYVPPIFLTSGAPIGANAHIVFGGNVLNFSSSTTASTTITLSGSAAFSNNSSYAVFPSLNATTGYIVTLAAIPSSGTQFTITATYTSAITTTIGVAYFCVGQ